MHKRLKIIIPVLFGPGQKGVAGAPGLPSLGIKGRAGPSGPPGMPGHKVTLSQVP